MEFFKAKTTIQFMKQRNMAFVLSAIIFIVSIGALLMNGLSLGLDFTGGTQVTVTFAKPVNVNQLRQKLRSEGFKQAVVQTYTTREVSVRVAPHADMTQKQLQAKLKVAMPDAVVGQSEYIGPQVGKQLMTNGILAILVSLIGTMIYIAMRFDYRFALTAAIALIHDPLLILGVFAFFHFEFNMIVLTALLTVIGYSLNDTIVVYDRVRENFRKMRKGTPLEIMDSSINQTLSRTIMTSGLTLLVVIALFLYGGATIHGFALALIIGIVVGTYSSIYVAGSLAILFGLSRTSLMPAHKAEDDGRP